MNGSGILVGDGQKINIDGEIQQISNTRANDNGFCDGDQVGVFIVDYQNDKETPGALAITGNRANNLKHTFDEASGNWNSAFDVFYKDDVTPVDVYGYYPYSQPSNIEAYNFEVKKDQSQDADGSGLGGYEASDFLWAKATKIPPTAGKILLSFHHMMASVKVSLLQGEGFAEGEWNTLEKQVLIKNTMRNATINLATGEVTAIGDVANTGIIPYKKDDYFRAIVVPQEIEAGTQLLSLTIGGKPYSFSLNETATYQAGKITSFNIIVDKKADTGTYTLTLSSQAIQAWENDQISHDATCREYVIVESTPGGLQAAIEASGKNYAEISALKVTGEVDARDFDFMRDQMGKLAYLNMKDAKIRARDYSGEDEIPSSAFSFKKSLVRFTFPDKLLKVGESAFRESGLSGSLVIPEGVKVIGDNAFVKCSGSIVYFPSTLEYIGDYAFEQASFSSELKFPEGLKYIGDWAFRSNSSLYGELKFPEGLEYLGEYAFAWCVGLSGDLIVPSGIKDLKRYTFAGCGFHGKLSLPENLIAIGEYALYSNGFIGELSLPANLVTLSFYALSYNNFWGTLVLPSNLVTIGEGALASNAFSGTLEIPSTLKTLGSSAFESCSLIEKLVLPSNIELVPSGCFSYCTNIGSIICNSTLPPYVADGAFAGVPKDNFAVEVPEGTVKSYQAATGWSDFKRITAHHELTCIPVAVSALNKSHSEKLTLRSEGAWTVESKPDWCTLSQTSGTDNRTELTVTIQDLANGSANRTGEIVFKLVDKDYTYSVAVSQYDYSHAEDEVIALQTASKGNKGGINLFFIGDGYDAKEISEGTYLTEMQQQMEYFFGIEPYSTYRDYFNVYTSIPLSQESGIGTVNTLVNNRFGTTYAGTAGGNGLMINSAEIYDYALQVPAITNANLSQSLIILTPNSSYYGGITYMWDDGSAIAVTPKSTMSYPYDTGGLVQHEAGGHGFGKLGDEYIYWNSFIQNCLSCYPKVLNAKANGWYDNLSLSGKSSEVPWYMLLRDNRYNTEVDIFEGGHEHTRGIYRSENTSCMNNNIAYFSAISRMSIVKRILQYAGETFDYETWVSKDVGTISTRAASTRGLSTRSSAIVETSGLSPVNSEPVILKGSPRTNKISVKKTIKK